MIIHSSRLQIAAALMFLVCGCGQAMAQDIPSDSVQIRNDCRLARQVITAGHPLEKRNWALAMIVTCADAAEALALAWEAPLGQGQDLAKLEFATREVQDQRIIPPPQRVASDPGATKLARIAALSTLMSYIKPSEGLPPEESLLSGQLGHFAIRMTTGASPREGEQPVTPLDRMRIVQWFAAQSLVDSDPGVRAFFARLARAYESQLR